jgi:hypothetical protein
VPIGATKTREANWPEGFRGIELDKHTIRSPVRGVVTAIYRQPGEAVRELEPVVQIEITPAR